MLTQFKTFRFSLIIFLFLFSNLAFTQSKFESGYVIDLNGQRKECLVEIINPIYTPQSFNYKLSEKSAIKKADISTIKEVGTENYRYVQFELEIDRSSSNINNLSLEKELEFVKDTLFLECLLDGEVDLFYYKNISLQRFFFETPTQKITPVHFKNFLISKTVQAGKVVDVKQVGENLAYKQQLFETFIDCSNIGFFDVSDLEHSKIPFIKYFDKVNACFDSEPVKYAFKGLKKRIHLAPRLGISLPSIDAKARYKNLGGRDPEVTTYNGGIGYSFGLQLESYPFKKMSYVSIVIEPTVQLFKDVNTLEGDLIELNYQTIDVAIGPKLYFFNHKKIKPFVKGAINFVFDLQKSRFSRVLINRYFTTNSKTHFLFSTGFMINDKFVLELQGILGRNIMREFNGIEANYNSINFLVGYRL